MVTGSPTDFMGGVPSFTGGSATSSAAQTGKVGGFGDFNVNTSGNSMLFLAIGAGAIWLIMR